jgi:hypothetical protein
MYKEIEQHRSIRSPAKVNTNDFGRSLKEKTNSRWIRHVWTCPEERWASVSGVKQAKNEVGAESKDFKERKKREEERV